jgi:tetratricopeptide (TPR) repeat protein
MAGCADPARRKSAAPHVKRSPFRDLAVLAVVLCISLPVRADCPDGSGAALPDDPAARAVLADRLASLAEACAHSSGYLAWYGALLNELGRPAEAALLLERALLINPALAGAEADYASALASLGDRIAAKSIYESLLERPDLPEHLVEPFRQRLRRLAEASAAPWIGGGSLTMRMGRETNLNSATSRATLDLTLSDGSIALPISADYRARAGGALLVEAAGQTARALPGGGALRLQGELRARTAPGASQTDYRQADALAQAAIPLRHAFGWAMPAKKTALLVEGGASLLDYGGERLYQALRAGLAGQWTASACLARLGLEAEAREFPVNHLLDGRYGAVAGGLRCPLGQGIVSLNARLSHDAAVGRRPGGDQDRLDLRLAAAHPLGRGALAGEIVHSRQADAEGYSSMLNHGATRNIVRTALRLEYIHPLTRRWEALATLEASRQHGNLDLFDIDNRALWLGLRRHFGE